MEPHKNFYIGVLILCFTSDSYKSHTIPRILGTVPKRKNVKYSSRVKSSLGNDLVPFIMISEGRIGTAAKIVLSPIANK